MSRHVKISLSIASLGLAAIVVLLLLQLGKTTARPKCGRKPIERSHWRRFRPDRPSWRAPQPSRFCRSPHADLFRLYLLPRCLPDRAGYYGRRFGQFTNRDEAAYEKLQPIFISVDPARDTPPVLRDYLAYFHPRLTGLTGSKAILMRSKAFIRFMRRAARRKMETAITMSTIRAFFI